MRNRLVTFALGLLLAVAVMAPAGATHGGIHPTKRTERVYFKCVDGQKLQNIPRVNGAIPTWNTTAPTQAFAQGGCGQYENLLTDGANPRNPHDAVWEGTFTGNLDNLSVEVHNIFVGAARTGGPFSARVKVFVDDVLYLNQGPVRLTPVPSSAGPSVKLAFSLTDFQLMTEDGDGTQQRTITLVLGSFTEIQSLWVWGSTDAPSGITFNPETLESVQLPVAGG